MNTDTGEIYEFNNEEERQALVKRLQKAGQDLTPLKRLPKPNCPHCYGRGYTGINITTGKVVPCKCCT